MARGTVTVDAEVLEIQHKQGVYNDNPYNFHVAQCLVGTTVLPVRFDADNADAPLPREGEHIRVEVTVPNNVRVTARRNVAAAAHAVKSA